MLSWVLSSRIWSLKTWSVGWYFTRVVYADDLLILISSNSRCELNGENCPILGFLLLKFYISYFYFLFLYFVVLLKAAIFLSNIFSIFLKESNVLRIRYLYYTINLMTHLVLNKYFRGKQWKVI